jgi:hypothetical protein
VVMQENADLKVGDFVSSTHQPCVMPHRQRTQSCEPLWRTRLPSLRSLAMK